MGSDEHQQIEDLLPRYATLLSEGKDVVAMYPLVAHHLKQCYRCRELLESLLASPWPNETLKLDPDDLTFFRQMRPLSAIPKEPTIPVSPTQDVDSVEVMRGFNAIQGGGRLLMQETLRIGEQDVTIVLTLHPEADTDTYTITGEIYADVRTVDIEASLDIDGKQLVANSVDGELVFENVKVDLTNPRIDLSFRLLR
jgi:hypothetical protein